MNTLAKGDMEYQITNSAILIVAAAAGISADKILDKDTLFPASLVLGCLLIMWRITSMWKDLVNETKQNTKTIKGLIEIIRKLPCFKAHQAELETDILKCKLEEDKDKAKD